MVRKGLLGLALVAVVACSPVDVLTSNYSTLAAARQDGAMARGSLPTWLPPQATGLRVVRSVSTGESAARFALPLGLEWSPKGECKSLNGAAYIPSRLKTFRWPKDKSLQWFYFKFECPSNTPGMRVYVALHGSASHGLYWRVAAP